MLPVFSILAAHGLWLFLKLYFKAPVRINPLVKTAVITVLLSLLFFGKSFLIKETPVSEAAISVESLLLKEVQGYFDRFPPQGAILTSLPLVAAQNDRLYVPMYECDAKDWSECFDKKISDTKAKAFIFYPNTFKCWNSDLACEARTASFFRKVLANEVLFKKAVSGDVIYVLATDKRCRDLR